MNLAKRDSRSLALALFLFLLATYLLNFSGRPHSSDGVAMLATAESLVRRGALDMDAYLWMGLQQGSFGPDGLLYSRKGLGQVLASVPLAWLGLHLPSVGLVQMALLLSPLVAALTASGLYLAVVWAGYGEAAALAVGLLYGLATPALPYSKYDFSDPLAGLALLAALLAVMAAWHNAGRRALAWMVAAGAAAGFAALTRTTSLIVAPVFLGAILWQVYRRGQWSRRLRRVPGEALAFVAGLSVMLVLLGLSNYRRYGNPLVSGYLPQESFSGNWLAGMAGLLFSPGRGLLFYAPLLALALPGWARLRRRATALAWLSLGIFMLHLVVYGKWFMWHGGYAWGPRFLLPGLPFLALCLAPLWQAGRRWRVAVLLLAAVSFVPQVLGSLVHFAPFEDSLLNTGLPLYAPATFWEWRYSPLLGQWRYIGPASLDFAWAQPLAGTAHLDWVALACMLAAVLLTAAALAATWKGRWRALLPSAGLAVALAASFMLVRSFAAGQQPLDAALRLLQSSERQGDALVTLRPSDSQAISDRYKGRLPAYGLPQPEAGQWPQWLGGHYERLWLLRDDTPLEQNALERWLADWGYQVLQKSGKGWRLALYARPPELMRLSSGPWVLGSEGITLEQAGMAFEGDTVFLDLTWRAAATPSRSYKVFVHVYDPSGNLVAQADSMPALWQRPTDTWLPGELVEDRHALLLPAGAHPAVIRLGLYDAETGERLTTPAGQDAIELAGW